MTSICILNAYEPSDAAGNRLLAAYIAGATAAGHPTDTIAIRNLRIDDGFPALPGSNAAFSAEGVAQRILRAAHLAIFVPVHRDHIPPFLLQFVNRVFLTDAFGHPHPTVWGTTPFLNLKTARIISTLDAGSWEEFQRTRTARFHPLKKSVLEFMGFQKVRTTTVPPIYDTAESNPFLKKWMGKIQALGAASF